MSSKYSLIVLYILLHVALAEETQTDAPTSERSEYKKSFFKSCANSYSVTCLKLDIVSWIDKLNENENLDVFQGVSIVRENNDTLASTSDIVADIARDFPKDPESRLDAFLVKKVQDYLSSHSVKLNLYDPDNEVTGRRGGGGGGGFGGGGGGKKGGGGGGGGFGSILIAAAMMKSTLLALALGGLAAIAGKALMTGLISLMLSAIIGLKSLTGGHGKTTYEVVSKPIVTHSASHSTSHEDYGHGHSGYGRSFDNPLPLGLQPEYKPE